MVKTKGGKMKLTGALSIWKYLGCSEPTLMQLILNEDLPVSNENGVFVATTEGLDKWRGGREAEAGDAAKPKAKAKKQRGAAAKPKAKAK